MKTEIIYGLITVLAIALFMLISFCRNSYRGKTDREIYENELRKKNNKLIKEKVKRVKKDLSWRNL